MIILLKIIVFVVFVAAVGILVFKNTVKWASAVQQFYIRKANKSMFFDIFADGFKEKFFLITCRAGIVFVALWLIIVVFSFLFGTIYP